MKWAVFCFVLFFYFRKEMKTEKKKVGISPCSSEKLIVRKVFSLSGIFVSCIPPSSVKVCVLVRADAPFFFEGECFKAVNRKDCFNFS